MLINILWMFGANVYIEYQQVTYGGPMYKLIYILSIIQFSISLFYAGGYKRCKGALAISKAKRQIKKKSD